MKTRILLITALLVLFASVLQAASEIWTIAKPPQEAGDTLVSEGSFQVYTLDPRALAVALNRAPRESNEGTRKDAIIALPMPDGTFASVSVVESPIMEPRMAAQLGGFSTYIAQGADDPTIVGRLDNSPFG